MAENTGIEIPKVTSNTARLEIVKTSSPRGDIYSTDLYFEHDQHESNGEQVVATFDVDGSEVANYDEVKELCKNASPTKYGKTHWRCAEISESQLIDQIESVLPSKYVGLAVERTSGSLGSTQYMPAISSNPDFPDCLPENFDYFIIHVGKTSMGDLQKTTDLCGRIMSGKIDEKEFADRMKKITGNKDLQIYWSE